VKKFIITSFYLIFISSSVIAEDIESSANTFFHIGQMNSHNKSFALFFKTRDKAILARGEDYNYVTDFPQDLYIYNYKTKISSPLKDNNTLVMISAIKNIKKNFKFDIANKKLNSYPSNGKFDFIISSIAKNCGHSNLKENYKCSYYKPLISNNLIN
jgi:hypothetical protein